MGKGDAEPAAFLFLMETIYLTGNMQKPGVSAGDIAAYLASNATLPGNAIEFAKIALEECIAKYQNIHITKQILLRLHYSRQKCSGIIKQV